MPVVRLTNCRFKIGGALIKFGSKFGESDDRLLVHYGLAQRPDMLRSGALGADLVQRNDFLSKHGVSFGVAV